MHRHIRDTSHLNTESFETVEFMPFQYGKEISEAQDPEQVGLDSRTLAEGCGTDKKYF